MAFKKAVNNTTLDRQRQPDLSMFTINTVVSRGSGLGLSFSSPLLDKIKNHWPKILPKSLDILYDKISNRIQLRVHNTDTMGVIGEFELNGNSTVYSHSFNKLGMRPNTTYRAVSVVTGDGITDDTMTITFCRDAINGGDN